MLSGTQLTFDEESKALYDAVAPEHPASYFNEVLRELEPLLPGSGSLIDRYDRFRNDFVIPTDRLAAVFDRAIEECRSRTLKHVELPATETFKVEYVTGKSWSGYNWYQGNYHSLIQVNTDLPIYIDRAVDLACHEGYPGHHVYNVLLEKHLVRDRGWIEFTAYPLFSPQSLIAEGTANYGIEVAFPGEERTAFERDVLFPLAGLQPARAATYYRVQALADKLAYAGNEAARGYLNGRMDRAQAASWLVEYAMMSPPRAEQRTRFIDQYRSYVINYNLGKDLVKDYIESRAGGRRRPALVGVRAAARLAATAVGPSDREHADERRGRARRPAGRCRCARPAAGRARLSGRSRRHSPALERSAADRSDRPRARRDAGRPHLGLRGAARDTGAPSTAPASGG